VQAYSLPPKNSSPALAKALRGFFVFWLLIGPKLDLRAGSF
jgi:hypothetical protein